jgi:hypothetical protein
MNVNQVKQITIPSIIAMTFIGSSPILGEQLASQLSFAQPVVPQNWLITGDVTLQWDGRHTIKCLDPSHPSSQPNPALTGDNVHLRFGAKIFAANSPIINGRGLLSGTTHAIGSWTIRGIFPADRGMPEHVTSYYFDGKISSGNIHLYKGFSIKGQSDFIGYCLPTSRLGYNTTPVDIVISASCGENQNVYFTLYENGHKDLVGIFNGNVNCVYDSNAPFNLSLDHH